MTELFDAAFSPVNLPYTVLLIFVMGYWLIAIMGLIDIGGFDMDLDVDADVDVDVDLDLDADAGVESDGLGSWLAFLNFGDVPVMFHVSIVVLSMWVVSVQLNYFLEPYLSDYQVWFAIALLVPNLIFGLLMAKLFAAPFAWFAERRQHEAPLVGKMCLVTSLEVTEKSGQCEIQLEESPVRLNVCARGSEVLKKGDTAVIVQRDRKNNIYTVTKYHSETETA